MPADPRPQEPTRDRDVLTRPAPPPDAVLRYGEHPDQVVDLRLPPGRAVRPAPLAVVVHGGFWRGEWDRTHAGPLSAGLAEAGFAVATVEYRRPGLVVLDDAARAIDAAPGLAAGAAPAAVDPTRTVLVGHSAGGHLVLWAAARPGPHPPPSGVVALAGVCDLVAAERDDLDGGAVRDLLGAPAAAAPHLDPARLPAPAVPTVLVHGTDDPHVPVRQSRDYAAAHPGTGYVELPGCGHFALLDPRSRAWPAVLAAVRRVTPGLTTLR